MEKENCSGENFKPGIEIITGIEKLQNRKEIFLKELKVPTISRAFFLGNEDDFFLSTKILKYLKLAFFKLIYIKFNGLIN